MKLTKKQIENIGTVCDGCARELGFVPKKKVVGVWMDECEVCRERTPCTDLWHDWVKANKIKCVKGEK